MGLRLLTVLALWSAVLSSAQAPDTDQLVAQLRRTMQSRLARMPDYSCLQTVRRTIFHDSAPGGWQTKDGYRLEVAFLDDQELYSWPGSDGFENTSLVGIVGSGFLASG